MEESRILFDDWATRSDAAFNGRKKAYFFCIICVSFMLIASIIGVFFECGVIVAFVISLIALIYVTLEWLKVKHNHLIIRENQIEITNRFKKTTIYHINTNDMLVELSYPFNRRSGGIIMRFFDSDSNFVCKYEDMLNMAAPFGAEPSDWEKSITALGVQIKDPAEIIKNR